MLDPVIYRPGKSITIAGEFIGTRAGRLDEAEYLYPLFSVRDMYLWEERMYYYPPPFGWGTPYWGYRPFCWQFPECLLYRLLHSARINVQLIPSFTALNAGEILKNHAQIW